MDNLITLIFQLVVLLMSVVIHEFSHGWVAYKLGDPTAKYYGRLTLNPLKHLDLVGSFIVPLIMFFFVRLFGGGVIFGWAKPVPFNPYNLRDQRYGAAKVAAAGPGANLLIALIFGLFLRFGSLSLAEFNSQMLNLIHIFGFIVFVNVLLAIFNLIPVPPLDGSKLLFAFLPYKYENIKIGLERYGFLILLLFVFFILNWVFLYIILPLSYLIVGQAMFNESILWWLIS